MVRTRVYCWTILIHRKQLTFVVRILLLNFYKYVSHRVPAKMPDAHRCAKSKCKLPGASCSYSNEALRKTTLDINLEILNIILLSIDIAHTSHSFTTSYRVLSGHVGVTSTVMWHSLLASTWLPGGFFFYSFFCSSSSIAFPIFV